MNKEKLLSKNDSGDAAANSLKSDTAGVRLLSNKDGILKLGIKGKVDGDDKRKIIRNLGIEKLFKNVETAFQRIRAALENKGDGFFF